MDMDYSLLYSIDSNTWSDSAVNGAVDKVSKIQIILSKSHDNKYKFMCFATIICVSESFTKHTVTLPTTPIDLLT